MRFLDLSVGLFELLGSTSEMAPMAEGAGIGHLRRPVTFSKLDLSRRFLHQNEAQDPYVQNLVDLEQ